MLRGEVERHGVPIGVTPSGDPIAPGGAARVTIYSVRDECGRGICGRDSGERIPPIFEAGVICNTRIWR